MRNLSLLLYSFFILTGNAISQGQYNNWHFGINSAIHFNSGNPLFVTGSQVIANEATASISNAAGNLLFYTNGETVWNASNAAMPNGTGLLAWDDVQQGVLIVPKPGSSTLYYVFTIGLSIASPGGNTKDLRYSMVDMSLNGGLGDVTTKNVFLDVDVTERLTATRHQNGTDFWIIEKNLASNQFKTFLISSAGIGSPVISSGGVPIQSGDFTGAVKVSNNGCWLVSTTRGAFGNQGLVELFHFNSLNGSIFAGAVTTFIEHPYGFEFSPDDSKFYVGENDLKPVYQFNLTAGTASQVLTSAVAVSGNLITFGFQAAPNGKIYFTRAITTQGEFQRTLAAIENPNAAGSSCNVNLTAFSSASLFNTGCLPNNFDLTYTGALNGCIVVPVSLLYFKAVNSGNNALLTWATSAEYNSSNFEVQVSKDANHFNTIGAITASGNSNTTSYYNFTDPFPVKYNAGIIYYRLKQMDIDNQFDYSGIAILHTDSRQENIYVTAYPDPFSTYISLSVHTVSAPAVNGMVELYTADCRLVYSRRISGQGSFVIKLDDLPVLNSGLYVLKTKLTNKISYIKLLKK